MRFVHLIVVGNESVEDHLNGTAILGAYRAILFDVGNLRREKCEQLMWRLREMNVPSQRTGTDSEDYRDIYWSGRSIFETYVNATDVTFAFNLSAGSRMALAALEDSMRTPMGAHFHAPVATVIPAFRYELIPGEKKGVKIAPLTFPQVPMVEPGGKMIMYMGLSERVFVLYQRFKIWLLHHQIRWRRTFRFGK